MPTVLQTAPFGHSGNLPCPDSLAKQRAAFEIGDVAIPPRAEGPSPSMNGRSRPNTSPLTTGSAEVSGQQWSFRPE